MTPPTTQTTSLIACMIILGISGKKVERRLSKRHCAESNRQLEHRQSSYRPILQHLKYQIRKTIKLYQSMSASFSRTKEGSDPIKRTHQYC